MGCADLLNQLPFDPDWGFTDVFLSRAVTTPFKYDFVTRQGASNVIDKIRIISSEYAARIEVEYLRHGRVWWEQLLSMVGDHVWNALDQDAKERRGTLRGEFEYFRHLPNKLAEFKVVPKPRGGHPLQCMARFSSPMMSDKSLTKRIIEVCEQVCLLSFLGVYWV